MLSFNAFLPTQRTCAARDRNHIIYYMYIAILSRTVLFGSGASEFLCKGLGNLYKSLTTCRKALTTCRKALTTCRKTLITCRKTLTTCRKTLITCRKTLITCCKALTTCYKSLTLLSVLPGFYLENVKCERQVRSFREYYK